MKSLLGYVNLPTFACEKSAGTFLRWQIQLTWTGMIDLCTYIPGDLWRVKVQIWTRCRWREKCTRLWELQKHVLERINKPSFVPKPLTVFGSTSTSSRLEWYFRTLRFASESGRQTRASEAVLLNHYQDSFSYSCTFIPSSRLEDFVDWLNGE